ncbi:type I methionyl aminopeptidase [Pseudoalteromonas sp. S2721]|uniref:type I methionyl aminopeptidase n=1 Tax=Pseudoalteromonas sp. S2721 TaxID=579526 RepID=UPI00110A37B4|nr:type I methionyl aminopeptidase [Pseudoalteromonas sp. S2721]TMP17728.1 type I methionyl aminopeptidase [Pseudoalteromonas sp. S2721]
MSKVVIKNADEIALMRESGRLLADVFAYLDPFVKEGVTTMEINDLVERYIVEQLQARPSSKGQYGYPYVLNASVNEVVCHGFPSEKGILKAGDIVNIDITLEKNGYLADSSKMYLIGDISPLAKRLVDTTQQALWHAIKMVKPGVRLGDIGNAIANFAHQHGYSVVKEYCGHGIGQQMHEEPQVLHYGKKNTGLVLKEGMTFTIEPMINQGAAKVKTKPDGWTVVTRDKKLSAQWEHTLAVTAEGVEVLTLREEEQHFLK